MKRLLFLPLLAASLLTRSDPTNNLLTNCIIQEVVPGKKITVAFFTLYHEGMAQSIVSAAIPSVSDHVELHHVAMKNGLMEMEEIRSYPLQNGETLFAEGGYHLMLWGIKNHPEIGSKHPLTITFDDGGMASCEATVRTMEQVMKANKREN